jgi:GNAT superfamily N-acetyltransferase
VCSALLPEAREDRQVMEIDFEWRGDISDAELVALTESYGGNSEVGWWDRIRPYSLGWVTARVPSGEAAGFVNVAWDGGDHAFLIDTKVRADLSRRGIGTDLVRIATHFASSTSMPAVHEDKRGFDRPSDIAEASQEWFAASLGWHPALSSAVTRTTANHSVRSQVS